MSDLYRVETTSRGPTLIPSFHAGQLQAWESQARFILVLSGTQGGKTSWGPLWLHREVERCGPGDYLAVSPTYKLLSRKMLPELLALFVDTLGWTFVKSDMEIRKQVGRQTWRIMLLSADNPESLESATALACWGDELGQTSVDVRAYEALRRRLSLGVRRGFGRLLVTTTPYSMGGWLKLRLYDPWLAGRPEYDVIQFPSIYNPAFDMREFFEMRRDMPLWKWRMFYLGQFTRPAGLVYSYDEGRNLLRYAEMRDVLSSEEFKQFPRAVGIDFGLANTAIVWSAHNPATGDIYLYREFHGGELSQEQHAARCKEFKEPVRRWLGGAPSEDGHRSAWATAGIGVENPFEYHPDMWSQIDHANSLLLRGRVHICEHLAGLINQLSTMSFELDEMGEPIEGKIAKKAQYHNADAFRYMCTAYTSNFKIRESVAAESGVRRIPAPRRKPGRRVHAIG